MSSSKTTLPSETYDANCHCGLLTYSVTLSPPLFAPENTEEGGEKPFEPLKVNSCDCSICVRNGYLLVYPDRSQITWHHNSFERAKRYRFNSKDREHLFCGDCGTSIGIDFQKFANKTGLAQKQGTTSMDIVGMSVRPFSNIDLTKLTYRTSNGKTGLHPPMDCSGKWYQFYQEKKWDVDVDDIGILLAPFPLGMSTFNSCSSTS